MNPPLDADLSVLPGAVAVMHDRQPERDQFAKQHEMRDRIEASGETVVVFLPRERAAAKDWIARAMATGCPVVVDGVKTDGAESLLKECRKRATVDAVISKAHGKLFTVTGGDFSDWIAEPATNGDGFTVPVAGFSTDGIDPGTAALLNALPPLKGHVIDLGAGWGPIARHVLQSPTVTACDLVEAHRPSLDCARTNVFDPRAAFHWADATGWTLRAKADHVVTNPPFHRGRAGDPGLGRAFIATAARSLAPRGVLWLVANRHLPYEAALTDLFAEVTELPAPGAFKLFRAARPRKIR
ncbi:class I SAM-dependent methyltransferase [Palleronia sp. THAF1]|uniref:class I SAM-dependent methyltransferase n=1 Tax=Palleronia sp. THAF1 TaxID=2587842 RepID=UPI0020C814D0|nr:methyltransferase [Palleronia sp. THAF1]